MSILQTDIVDFISINKEGKIVLTISDHLEWDQNNEHLLLLQQKLNTYLQFIESGELLQSYPDAQGRIILISIVSMFPPSTDGKTFIELSKSTIENAGYSLQLTHTNSDIN